MAHVSKKSKRRLFLLCTVLIGIVAFLVSSVFQDWVQIFENKNATNELTSQLHQLLEEEKSLTSEVTKLQDPKYVARYAREKYLYSAPGEIIIRIPKETK